MARNCLNLENYYYICAKIFILIMYMAEKTTKLADKLYLLRAERRLQSKDVASVIGLEPPKCSRIEGGERSIKPGALR